MNIFALCGVALIAYAALQILGKDRTGVGAAIGLGGLLCLLLPAVLSLSGLMKDVRAYIDSFQIHGADLLFRGLGIGFCCEITTDILRDAGNTGLANALEFSCRVAILALCIPLWKELMDLAGGLLK